MSSNSKSYKINFFIALIFSVVFPFLLLSACGNSNEKINLEAQALIKEGKYEEAEELLSKIADNDRSASNAIHIQIPYLKAQEMFKNGAYDEALPIFAALAQRHAYDDAAIWYEKTQWESGLSQLEKGDFDAAYMTFSKLQQSFIDKEIGSKAKTLSYYANAEKNYSLANSLEGLGDDGTGKSAKDYLTEAQASYEAAGDYSDSEGKAEECKGRIAEIDRLIVLNEAQAQFGQAVNAQQAKMDKIATFIEKWNKNNYITIPEINELVNTALVMHENIKKDKSLAAPILDNPETISDKDIEFFLDNYNEHIDYDNVLAVQKKRRNIKTKLDSGVVSVEVSGMGITNTSVTITNNTGDDIWLDIPLGTYFSASSKSVQNMVVRSAKNNIHISPHGKETVSVNTACMNIRREIPYEGDTFSLAQLEDNSLLARVIKSLDKENADYATTQAAVWIVTDKASTSTLTSTLYQGDNSVINIEDVQNARKIIATVK
jgi:tetratricopeptide (TPR) repeat protein